MTMATFSGSEITQWCLGFGCHLLEHIKGFSLNCMTFDVITLFLKKFYGLSVDLVALFNR